MSRALGWVVGFEPTTAGATVRSSTTELHPPSQTKIIASGRGALFADGEREEQRAPAKSLRQATQGEGLAYRAVAVHHAAIRLSAARSRRSGMTALADGEGRKLLLQLRSVALGTFRRLLAKQDGFKSVSTVFATVFENRHTCLLPDFIAVPSCAAASLIQQQRMIQPL
jgi:hypothetical protein